MHQRPLHPTILMMRNPINILVASLGVVLLAGTVWLLLLGEVPENGPAMAGVQTGSEESRQGTEMATVSEESERRQNDAPVLTASPKSSISGLVVGPRGNGVSGAVVASSGGQRVTANKQGAFHFEQLEAGEHWLWVEVPSFTMQPAPPVRLAQDTPVTNVVLRLEPERHLGGTLVLEDGSPVVDATIEATVRKVDSFDGVLPSLACWTTPVTATSDRFGSFELSGLPLGMVELIVSHSDTHTFGRLVATDTQSLEILLTPVGGITGRVVHAETGEAAVLERVTLLASVDDEEGPWRQVGEPQGVPEADRTSGRFRASARTNRWLRLVAEGPDIAPATSSPFRVDENFAFGPLLLEAMSGVSLRLRAVDENGRGVPNAEVSVVALDTADGLDRTGAPFARQAVKTGADGSARSKPLAPGRYRIEVSQAGYLDGASEPIELRDRSSDDVYEIVLTRAASIRGRLLTPNGGTLPELDILALRVEAEGLVQTSAPEMGELTDAQFIFPRLEAGGYILRLVDKSTHQVVYGELPVLLRPGVPEVVEFDVDSLGTSVEGQYTLNGEPMPGAEVLLGTSVEAPAWRCLTDQDGRFNFTGVGSGMLYLKARLEGDQACFAVQPIEVVTGEKIVQDVRISSGSMEGRLLDTYGQALDRTIVLFEQELNGEQQIVAQLRTDDSGCFGAEHLPQGTLRLSTRARYHANVHHQEITVNTGSPEDPLQLRLAPAGELEFHFKRRPGMALQSGVSIEAVLQSDLSQIHNQGFGAGERPRLTELPRGVYDIHVKTTDGLKASAQATVIPGATRTVIVEF
jgi:hypothetical protein